MHVVTCARSRKDPSTCKCTCHGELHGSAWKSVPPRVRSAPVHQSKNGWGTAIAATTVISIGFITFTASSGGSSAGRNSLSVQVKVDLDKALGALASRGFHRAQSPNASTWGPRYSTNCAQNATGAVAQFLTRHPCKQYASATRTVSQPGDNAQVGFSWVEMPSATLADQYKSVVDTYGTGNPPGLSPALDGHCYASGLQGAKVWTVEVQPTGKVNIDRKVLQAAVWEQLTPSYLRQHCVI